MAGTIVLVTHDTSGKDDRASRWAMAEGYRLEWTCPAEGGDLPKLGDDIAGVIVYGGRYDVRDSGKHPFLVTEMKYIEGALKRDIPYLGLCLGGQLLAGVLGEKVGPHPKGHAEYGYYDLTPTPQGKAIFGGELKVLQSHWHGWYETPKDTVLLGGTEHFPQQAFQYGARAFAFQFHPEASRNMLQAWIGRRPSERHAMPGAFPAERQLADNLLYDRALGDWFNAFLTKWNGRQQRQEAAE